MVPRRYVPTGGPGSGETAIAVALRARGWAIVEEAATDVIIHEQARGVSQPWQRAEFVDQIAELQRDRRRQNPPSASLRQVTALHTGAVPVPRAAGHPGSG